MLVFVELEAHVHMQTPQDVLRKMHRVKWLGHVVVIVITGAAYTEVGSKEVGHELRIPVKLEDRRGAAKREATQDKEFDAALVRVPNGHHVKSVLANDDLPIGFSEIIGAVSHTTSGRNVLECCGE